MIAYILLRRIKKFHHLLLRQPHILALEPHIHPGDSVIVLVDQESLTPIRQFVILFLCHISITIFYCPYFVAGLYYYSIENSEMLHLHTIFFIFIT
jgi:hypothetical protein